uniref:Uncharacterized protein n=1 Tax=Bracon brevicornis TaxID=1563983 RepID=A0A6V7KS68_9HYME
MRKCREGAYIAIANKENFPCGGCAIATAFPSRTVKKKASWYSVEGKERKSEEDDEKEEEEEEDEEIPRKELKFKETFT